MGLLKWSLIFLAIAVVAAVLGFGGIAEGAADIAQVLFFVFLGLCALFLILGVAAYKKITD